MQIAGQLVKKTKQNKKNYVYFHRKPSIPHCKYTCHYAHWPKCLWHLPADPKEMLLKRRFAFHFIRWNPFLREGTLGVCFVFHLISGELKLNPFRENAQPRKRHQHCFFFLLFTRWKSSGFHRALKWLPNVPLVSHTINLKGLWPLELSKTLIYFLPAVFLLENNPI